MKQANQSFFDWLNKTSPAYTWDWAWQLYVQSQLEEITAGRIRKLMLSIPPQHGKSSLVTERYPVYRLCKDPTLRVGIGSYNQDFANRFGRRTRKNAIDANLAISRESRSVSDWETLEQGGVISVGVGSGVTGRPVDLLIIDDPVKSRKEADSLAYRERVWDWYTDDLYTRLQENAPIILIMTRWHEDDLAGRILASEDGPNWKVINLPAEAEENDILGREIGEPLCPERFSKAALEDKKRVLGTRGYTALYQGKPTPAEGGIIKRDWIKYWDKLPKNFDIVIQSWDMAFKDTNSGSYVVGQVWGKTGADSYLLDQVRGQWDFPTCQAKVKELSKRWPEARLKLIEDKANGPAIIASLKREISGLVPVSVQGSKEARLSAVSPIFESGNVYLPHTHWVLGYVDELCSFPNAANDDQADATSQALDRFYSKRPVKTAVGGQRKAVASYTPR